ncbi:hypothetical protein [Croceimicrobium hydrocarbonivorans]|uniref:Uncharacterized protein n=1 Tax=Croceimicrobium hydrocarbonivorans TaxID=2761580 RepID=A0A7H0VB43_9FLAO|nr:hypothetical protein [Croceimicrobium hydrocarbonivorans]QNR22941.1 hypothetical protein H4K34_11185 [Croceimicrobium hydrocarbonivorans]QNR22984.1 hypothetical protein H4K34_11400 [Croceimicrobium hydrocarbonivorans]
MPYWIRTKEGVMWFEFVRAETSKEDLLAMIKQGIIYILERHRKGYE